MGCTYTYYKEDEKYCPFLYCKVDNKKCHFSKKCLKVDKWIQLDEEIYKECPKFIEQQRIDIPQGSYFIQDTIRGIDGKLSIYAIINNCTEKIHTEFTDINQNYIYLKEEIDGYSVSLTPFNE